MQVMLGVSLRARWDSTLVLTIIACTQSVDNLFHTLNELGEWILSNIQSASFLHQREVKPSSYFAFLNFDK